LRRLGSDVNVASEAAARESVAVPEVSHPLMDISVDAIFAVGL